MRLLIVSSLYPPLSRGGAEVVLADFAGQLTTHGIDVHVLTGDYGLAGAADDGQVYRRLAYRQPPRYRRDRSVLGQLGQLADYRATYFNGQNARVVECTVAEIRPDVVLLGSPYGLGAFSIVSRLARLGVPVVPYLQDFWVLEANAPELGNSTVKLRWLKRALAGFTRPEYIAGRVRSFVATSDAVMRRHLGAGLRADQFEVVRYGMPSASMIARPERAETTREIVYVGRLVPEKGIHVLIEALGLANRRLAGERTRLHVVGGNGPKAYEEGLRSAATECGVDDDIVWHGWQDRRAITDLHDRAAALVVPSLWEEPLGTVVVEAMVRGLPAVVSRRGGLPELIDHERNGLVVESHDPAALADAIERIVTAPPDSRAAMSGEALAVARERFNLERNGERLAGILAGAA